MRTETEINLDSDVNLPTLKSALNKALTEYLQLPKTPLSGPGNDGIARAQFVQKKLNSIDTNSGDSLNQFITLIFAVMESKIFLSETGRLKEKIFSHLLPKTYDRYYAENQDLSEATPRVLQAISNASMQDIFADAHIKNSIQWAIYPYSAKNKMAHSFYLDRELLLKYLLGTQDCYALLKSDAVQRLKEEINNCPVSLLKRATDFFSGSKKRQAPQKLAALELELIDPMSQP